VRTGGGLFFEDFAVGRTFRSPTRTITETDVVLFGAWSGDMNELHTSETYARDNLFGRRIAHGLLGLSIAHGFLFRIGLFEGTGIAFLSVEDWKFTAPVFIGDTVHAEIEVAEAIPSRSKPDRGVVKFRVALKNEAGTTVQEGLHVVMVKRRGKDASSGDGQGGEGH